MTLTKKSPSKQISRGYLAIKIPGIIELEGHGNTAIVAGVVVVLGLILLLYYK